MVWSAHCLGSCLVASSCSASLTMSFFVFFFSSRRRHTRWNCDWSSDVCSSDLNAALLADRRRGGEPFCEQTQHVESADQIDIDDADKLRQRIDTVLADGALRAADAGAVHQHARDAVEIGRASCRERV